jgi:hypothetical protein
LVRAGDLAEVVAAIGAGMDVNAHDDGRWTALHWVVAMGADNQLSRNRYFAIRFGSSVLDAGVDADTAKRGFAAHHRCAE